MGTQRRYIEKGIICIFTVVFIGIYLQHEFQFIKETPLSGAITYAENPPFNLKDWFSGIYQEKEEKYLNENFGLRPTAMRFIHQVRYDLYDKAEAQGVVIGKDDYLFEMGYIDAWFGTDFVGEDSILRQVKKLKYLQDTLLKVHKTMLLVLAPGKGSFYHEYIPDKYNTQRGKTNYEYYAKYSSMQGLNYIDFWKYFMENKPKAKYPLYTRYGIHWSSYGRDIAFDSIISYIRHARNIDMPNITWDKIELSNTCRDVDCDLLNGMNLLFNHSPQQLAYPVLNFHDQHKAKPKVLTISDSYYWGIFGSGMAARIFDNPHFYYYYNELNSPEWPVAKPKSEISLQSEINNNDVVMIICTDANLNKLGWGFIDDAYKLYKGK